MARLVFRAALLALCLLAVMAVPASAQYFGRNKVQYKDFDFQILKTEHFDIYFYPSEREGVEIAARLAERWFTRLEKLMQHQLSGRQPLILYASHPDFEQTNAIGGEIGEGTGGVTESVRRRIVLPLAGPLSDTDHVIGHELVHAFQYDIMIGPTAPEGGRIAGAQLPLWFIEGMAEYLTIGPVDPHTAMWLRDAAMQEQLPNIDDLDNPKYFPYRWGQAFWAYIGGRYGDEMIERILKMAITAGDLNVAFEQVLKVKTAELSDGWKASIREMYEPVIAATTQPNEIGRIAQINRDAGMNVAPAISPDGKWIAFFSERDLLSIELFIADASNGRIVRRLTSTATDPHFSSIQFIHSAGAWDRMSRRLAVGTVTSGRPALAIFDALSGDKEQEVPLPDLDEIFNPTFAPDGSAIAFTGLAGGLGDLYVYDLKASMLRRLTTDAYAELMPAWSPDGRRIAFATDRFSTNLQTLAIGQFGLGLIDVSTGAIEQVAGTSGSTNISPQWSPDGGSLYFISDRDGIPNLYRIALDSGDVAQLTRVATGLSGITSRSPALSVATEAGIVAFDVYQQGKYQIHLLDANPPALPPAKDAPPPARAATLPPPDRRASDVVASIEDATTGLPTDTSDFETEEYKARLGLEEVGAPSISVGADRFGAAISGGIGFRFGDMLGDQSLAVALQINAGFSSSYSIKNTAAQAMYSNTKHRWNWGLVGGQIPYLSGGTQSGVGTVQGEPVQVDQTVIERQTERSIAAVLAYPFNRAQRVEWQGGFSRIAFDVTQQLQVYSLRTGQRLVDESETTPVGEPINLATSAMALVFDTTSFGATSPVQGQRYRFELAPSFGTLNFTGVLTDYRRYFMPVPFYTIAARVLHYGRYGSGGEDGRLTPLYLGYPGLVRGYESSNITTGQCLPILGCSASDDLMGSRMLVGNLELRFPLLRPFGASSSRMYGPIPVEVALFTDGGVAWYSGNRPTFMGGDKPGVGSAGVSMRVNLGGFAIGSFDFSRPFQRNEGWVFQFTFTPGF
ncbi:MAG TPA: BamA/TamA family outer membrane protein [Vicinamibacterales bacterium]|nr:BamA/TamA family outer membrane protein [Vicinamibacterales bacterium]